MSLRELTKEYLTKAVYQTPLGIMKLMAAALEPKEGRVLDICGGSEDFLLRSGAIKPEKEEGELLFIENWTGEEDTSEGRENWLFCGPKEKIREYLKAEPEEEVFDFIFMNPPFGYMKGEGKTARQRLESQFLDQVADCLAPNGRCAAVVPNGLLTRTSGEDVALRKKFIEEYQVEQVILLPLASFLPVAEVSTGILVFSKGQGEGITRIFDLRKEENLKELANAYRKAEPVCVLNRAVLAEHRYILSGETYVSSRLDDHARMNRERNLKRRLNKLLAHIPSTHENENGQIGMFPCQRGMLNRRNVLREILECEYGLLECELMKYAEKEKWPETEGSTFFALKSGKRWDEAEKDGPYRVYGAAGVQGTAKTTSMEGDTALLIGRVGSYCGAVYKAWSKGFVSDNVMVVHGKAGQVEEDFLMLLLKAAHFNAEKRGSVQPYITKEIVLKKNYRLPDAERQKKFLAVHEELFQRLKAQEKEIEELSTELESI